jgi:hypothetical protein
MKQFTGVILFAALALSAPLRAQTQPADAQSTQNAAPAEKPKAAPATTAAKPTGTTDAVAATTEVKPKPAQPKKAQAPKKPKPEGDGSLSFDGTAATSEPKPVQPKPAQKKAATSNHSGVPVTREGGKTCSGRDEYRVCW